MVCCFCVGSGFQLFSAVFEPQEHTAWLKCLVLKFCLIAQRPLDEASPLLPETELATKPCTTSSQSSDISTQSLQPSASSNMPEPENHGKAVNQKKKGKGRSQTSASSVSSSAHAVDTAPVQRQGSSQAASSHSEVSSRRRHKAAKHHSMAVPAAADSEAVTCNGTGTGSPKAGRSHTLCQ